MISIFKELRKTDVPFHIPLSQAVRRIKEGSSKDLVESIRTAESKSEKNELKSKLPCILFAGKFSERNRKGLQEHSGLMILDFDDTPEGYKDVLKNNPYIHIAFISPSGTGVKAVVKIPACDEINHDKYFRTFKSTQDLDYLDSSGCDVSRICYESYDPEIFVNDDSKVFDVELEERGYEVKTRVPVVPITDDDVIIEFIMGWNWGQDFTEGNRNNFILNIAGAFCEYGVSKQSAINYIDNNVAIYNREFTQIECHTTINSAYKIRVAGSKYYEDYKTIDEVKNELSKGKEYVIDKYNITEEAFQEIKLDKEHDNFWFFDEKNKCKIIPIKYKYFLERNGFKKYYPMGAESPSFVKVISNIVNLTSIERIQDFVLGYLLERNEIDVWSYCVNNQKLFSDSHLMMLESIDLLMLRDTVNTSYVAFSNGIVKITKDKITLDEYMNIDGYVWQSHIVQREYSAVEDCTNDYSSFIDNISRGDSTPMKSTIGYLLYTYKNRSNVKAVLLNDETIGDNPEGGTGKGLIVQGLKQIRRVAILDGKAFDDKKSFPYQTVSVDDQILVFDDVKKGFNFESKFSLVTEGLTLERKNKDAIHCPVGESPKIVISTNYPVKGSGNSHERRRHEVEVAQYYGRDRTPQEEFGKNLFDDWNEDEFKRFDNFMLGCIQLHLNKGLIQQDGINTAMRKLIAETSAEFVEFIEDDELFTFGFRTNKVTSFNAFCEEYADFKRWLTQKRYTTWCKTYAKYKGYVYNEGKSNNDRWFEIEKIELPF